MASKSYRKRLPDSRSQSPESSSATPVYSSTGVSTTSSDTGPQRKKIKTASAGEVEEMLVDLGDEKSSGSREATILPEDACYHFFDDEEFEDADTVIAGETELDEDDTAPVRLLQDFTIYDSDTLELVDVLDIPLYPERNLRASGLVVPWPGDTDDIFIETDEVQEDENPSRLALSRILELNIHHQDDGDEPFDPKIYLRTKYAWYILDTPSNQYHTRYATFWAHHRLMHLVLTSCIEEPDITLEEFHELLHITEDSPLSIAAAMVILGREFTPTDLDDDFKIYMYSHQDELLSPFYDVPLIRTLLDLPDDVHAPRRPKSRSRSASSFSFSSSTSTSSSTSSSKSTSKRTTKPRKSGPPVTNKRRRQQEETTVVTERVGTIAQRLYNRTLAAANQVSDEIVCVTEAPRPSQKTNLPSWPVHDTNVVIEWGDPDSNAPDGYYLSVFLDGIEYRPGDFALVLSGEDSHKARSQSASHIAAQSMNKLANSCWVIKICSLFEEDGEKMLHGQWFQHASKTILQEAEDPRALYLVDECDDVKLDSIHQKANVRTLPRDEAIPQDPNSALFGERPENDFYHVLTWDPDGIRFFEPDEEFVKYTIANDVEAHISCFSCGLRNRRQEAKIPSPLPGKRGFKYHDTNYHVFDFVYVVPKAFVGVYLLAQIENVSVMKRKITVRYYGRYNDIHQPRQYQKLGKTSIPVHSHDLRLYRTERVEEISISETNGKFYVRRFTHSSPKEHILEWLDHDDHFFVVDAYSGVGYAKNIDDLHPLSKSIWKNCEECLSAREETFEEERQYLDTQSPLNGLELFAGAGGLATGMNKSRSVKTKWAIEWNRSACKTNQFNHPETRVFEGSVNPFLERAQAMYHGREKKAPEMPMPGDVDIIFGGPPCQSFSKANRSKRPDDVRSTLVCNMISFVEFYKPKYVLLENVVGLIDHTLQGRLVNQCLVGGIQNGVVKFICSALLDIGYQVQLRVLQAGQFGAPQSRNRVIFWGALRGYTLPPYPLPTHAYPVKSLFRKLAGGVKIPPVTRAQSPQDEDDYHQITPHHPVTVDDATNDLPGFEWIDPHIRIKATARSRIFEAERAALYPLFSALCSDATTENPWAGFCNPVEYALQPQNRFQADMRGRGSDFVTSQYTKRFQYLTVERTVNVPLRPGADHKDLPDQLQLNKVKSDGTPTSYQQLDPFRRLNGDGFFITATTVLTPSSKGGTILHPKQRRIITVREIARAQGFPDYYEFLSANQASETVIADQSRQIGNAVPVPLSYRLGRALLGTLMDDWRRGLQGLPGGVQEAKSTRHSSAELLYERSKSLEV